MTLKTFKTLKIAGLVAGLVGIIAIATAAPASAQTRITVQIGSGYGPRYYPPPPPPVVYAPRVVAPAPYRVGYVWQPGYFVRVGNSHHRRWVPGRYVRAPFWRGQGYANQGWRSYDRRGDSGPVNGGYDRGDYGQGFRQRR
jgi:hypothetical protein